MEDQPVRQKFEQLPQADRLVTLAALDPFTYLPDEPLVRFTMPVGMFRSHPVVRHDAFFASEVIDGVFGQRLQGLIDMRRRGTVCVATELVEQFDQPLMLCIDIGQPGFEQWTPFENFHPLPPLQITQAGRVSRATAPPPPTRNTSGCRRHRHA